MPKITLIKKNPTIEQTVELIKNTAFRYRDGEAVNVLLKKYPFRNTIGWFRNVFNEITNNTRYEYDERGREQIKSPDLFFLRQRFGDCDDYTVLWSALLIKLRIKHYIKIVAYNGSKNWAHVYVVVPVKNGNNIVLDNVFTKLRNAPFGAEVPHTKSKLF